MLSASLRTTTSSYVESGRATRERESRSSIWISVALRSCAATMLLRRSGWADRDGGERMRVLCRELVEGAFLRSRSTVAEGAMMLSECCRYFGSVLESR